MPITDRFRRQCRLLRAATLVVFVGLFLLLALGMIGLPWRITVGPRGLANGKVELTSRRTGESEEMSAEDAVARIVQIYEGR